MYRIPGNGKIFSKGFKFYIRFRTIFINNASTTIASSILVYLVVFNTDKITNHTIFNKVSPCLQMFNTEFCETIFAGFQSLVYLLKTIGELVEVFTRATFADIIGFFSCFKALAHIFGHVKKAEVSAILNISEQWVVQNSFKLFFLCQLSVIFGLRFFHSLNRMRKNTEVIEWATTLNLLLTFQKPGPFME